MRSKAGKLRAARQAVTTARVEGRGIFNSEHPIRVMPFELRFLSRKKGPDRYVLNLADEGGHQLLQPELYYTVHPEDRLFIPSEYVPIFLAYGWEVRKEA